MKSLSNYIIEGKQIDIELAKEIVQTVINDNSIDINELKKELDKYDYDMDTVLHMIDMPNQHTKLDTASLFIDCLSGYLDDKYSYNSNDYYDFIINKLYKLL